MRTAFSCLAALCLVGASALALAPPRQQAQPASASKAPSIEEALKAFRSDLQSSRADIIAKNVSLTAEQAAKFWPVFDKYQKEQSVIMDEQLKGIQQYAEKYE